MQFEELKMWNEAQDLYNSLDDIFSQDSFRNYFFRDQLLRAALSISNNIAEGFERETNNELRRFLYIAKGSCGEVRSMLYLAYKRQYIVKNDFEKFVDICKHISIMMYKYIEKL
ncbi:MAG: four helix bundle protein [candidate division SR1 bacterium]|nr:four helix bundle protein [candidate division SR1 bacterium]